ncbi:acyl-CoA dehydrogenase family protein [Mycobacterium sp. Lab-001]|uniref:acyl-CoA dehydrogenase family protein n=1 Tax=Mycobacterium sp. Lab-001 TaxID=3410136 RepID=UPI003D166527
MNALSDEQCLLRDAIEKFVDTELIPHETEPITSEFRQRIHAGLHQLGIWALGVPERFGGAGGTPLDRVVMIEQLSRSLLGPELIGRMGEPLSILFAATPDQQQRYLEPVVRGEMLGAFALTEPTGGADPVHNMTTTAVPEGNGWILDGRKCFVSMGDVADYVVVFARTDRTAGAKGITAFIVDANTPGFSVVRRIPTMGSMAPAEIDFQGCFVHDDNRVGEPGHGFLLAQRLLGTQRLEIGARATGACERLIDLAVDHVNSRESVGATLASQQGVQWILADCVLDLEAVRSITYSAAGREGDDVVAQRMLCSITKVFGSEALCRVADRVLQLFGGWGYSTEFPVERFYREVRMWRIVEGPNEVHRSLIGRLLTHSGTRGLRP